MFCAENPIVQRNPFCFSDDSLIIEKKGDAQKIDLMKEEQVQMIKTETKWEVKTVLSNSVIVQHKDDGQIREIALTGTNFCS